MKNFIIDFILIILMFTPVLSIIISLALIANGDTLGFTIFSVLGIISSGLVYGILKDKQTDYENK